MTPHFNLSLISKLLEKLPTNFWQKLADFLKSTPVIYSM